MTCDCGRELIRGPFGYTLACPCGAPPRAVREVGELEVSQVVFSPRTLAALRSLDAAEAESRLRHQFETPADRGERGEKPLEPLGEYGMANDDGSIRRVGYVFGKADGTIVRVPVEPEPPPPAPAAEGVPCCWWCGGALPHFYSQGVTAPLCISCNHEFARGPVCRRCGGERDGVFFCTTGCRQEVMAEVRRPGFVPRRNRKA